MHEVLVKRFGGLSLPRKSVARLTDRPDMTLDVYRGRKTTTTQQQIVFQSGVVGWGDGAGKLPVPGRLTNLDDRTRAYCACSGCGWGLFGHVFCLLTFLFLPLGDGPI